MSLILVEVVATGDYNCDRVGEEGWSVSSLMKKMLKQS